MGQIVGHVVCESKFGVTRTIFVFVFVNFNISSFDFKQALQAMRSTSLKDAHEYHFESPIDSSMPTDDAQEAKQLLKTVTSKIPLNKLTLADTIKLWATKFHG